MLTAGTNSYAIEFYSGGLAYNTLDDKTVEVINGAGDGYSGDIVIPEQVEYGNNTYTVTSIGEYAFMDCSRLTSVTIPNSVTSIGERAFFSCTGLTSVAIGESVTSIGGSAFFFCGSLNAVYITDLSAWCNIDFSEDDSNPLYYAHNLYLNSELITDLTIPDGFTEIKKYAFIGCNNIVSVNIPSSVTSIGSSAFASCNNLEAVHITDLDAWLSIDFTDQHSNPLYNAHNLYLNDELITDLTIPDGFTEIKKYTFIGCNNHASVTIPSSVATVGESAFGGCPNLKAVHIADLEAWCGITFANQEANPLYSAHSLYLDGELMTELTIPDNVTEIKGMAFIGCSNLTSVTIPNGVPSIGKATFENCSGLTAVEIPGSVTSLGESVFSGCSGLNELTIDDSTEPLNIGISSFAGCGIETLYLGRDIPALDYMDKSKLSELTIGGKVTAIGDNAFNGCSILKNITIDDSEDALALGNNGTAGLFSVCPLESVYVGRNLSYASDGNLSPFHGSTLSKLTIGNSVTAIGDNAFSGCQNIATVTITNSVTDIGMQAFNGCSGLHSVTIGTSVTSIGDNAFGGTDIKKAFWLPDTPPEGCKDFPSERNYVTNDSYDHLVSDYTVYPQLGSMFEADGLKYVPVNQSGELPICDAVDYTYDGREEMVISGAVSYSNVVWAVRDVNDYLCYNNGSLRSLRIDGFNGNIGDGAFQDCGALETVDLNTMEGVIGRGAFRGCTALAGIELPSTVTEIGSSCFEGCTSLAYINMGIGISVLPESCLSGCTALTEISIPSNMMIVGNNVFNGCTTLETVTVEDRQQALTLGYNSAYDETEKKPLFSDCPLDYVYVGGGLIYDTDAASGYSPFYSNASLHKVVITDENTTVPDYAFYECTTLEEVELGDGLEQIGSFAFSGCCALDNVKLGYLVASIGEEAFFNCSSMTRMECHAEMPPVCGEQAFDGINKKDCLLFVPVQSFEAYKTAEQWKEFFVAGVEFDTPSGVEDTFVDNSGISVEARCGSIEVMGATDNTVITVYSTSGQAVYCGTETTVGGLASGVYIVRIDGQTFKVAL